MSVFAGGEYNVITNPPRAYELKSSIKEMKRGIFDEGYIRQEEYPILIKPTF